MCIRDSYYTQLIAGVNDQRLKIYLYHIPQVSGVGLSIDLVKKLHADFPEAIVGIKDSSGVWDNTKALLEIDGLIVYPGAELPIIEAIRAWRARLHFSNRKFERNRYCRSD